MKPLVIWCVPPSHKLLYHTSKYSTWHTFCTINQNSKSFLSVNVHHNEFYIAWKIVFTANIWQHKYCIQNQMGNFYIHLIINNDKQDSMQKLSYCEREKLNSSSHWENGSNKNKSYHMGLQQ